MSVETMPQEARVSSRINAELKEKGDAILAGIGMKPSQAITILYTQIVEKKAFPIDINANKTSGVKSTDVSEFIGSMKGKFGDVETIDAYIRNERDSWD